MILVTGATGLVGSHLVYELLQKGYRVRAIKRENSSTEQLRTVFSFYTNDPQLLLNKIEWVKADVTDVFSLEDALEGIEAVFHCAAIVSFAEADKLTMHQTNVSGTANLVNAMLFKKVNRLIHVSSIAALGRAGSIKTVDEHATWKISPDNSNYAITKYLAECEVWRGSEEGLDVAVVNPSVIIGPGDWNKGSSKMIQTAYNGLSWYTLGSTGFVDVRDVAGAMVQLFEKNILNERFILNSENLSFKTFFDLACDALNKPRPTKNATPFISEIGWRLETLRSKITGKPALITKETARAANRSYSFSSDKIKKTIGYEFIPMKSSIEHACKCFLLNNFSK